MGKSEPNIYPLPRLGIINHTGGIVGKLIIECNNDAACGCLIPLLVHMRDIGCDGHSFPIRTDDTQEEGYEEFLFDGDGGHFIGTVRYESD